MGNIPSKTVLHPPQSQKRFITPYESTPPPAYIDKTLQHKASLVGRKQQSYTQSSASSVLSYPRSGAPLSDNSDIASLAYKGFLKIYPEYRLTWMLDALRKTDYQRLERTGETYVDYMGGALYPESLVQTHATFLNRNVLGNTHSVSNSSKLSLKYADEARAAVLSFFRAPKEYTVVFTANATAALKLVGESFPFTERSCLVLGTDSHNSVHGIREFASCKGAKTTYITSTPVGGMEEALAKNLLLRNRPYSKIHAPSLFVLTGQSNITNSKNKLSLIEYAASLGYHTLLDAAALMFGFPTGVGALIVKKSFLSQLQRPWFSGGTVDLVQVPGVIVTRAQELHEQFEDGTINYLTLPAIVDGLRFFSQYLPFLPLRLSCLLDFLTSTLVQIRHDTTKRPVVKILSRLPNHRPVSVGDQAGTGSTVSLLIFGPNGEQLPNSFVEYAASKHKISLRTGCMCNPGGAAALLGIEEDMHKLYPGATHRAFEHLLGHDIGVVRISLGLATNFQDVWKVLEFVSLIGREAARRVMLKQWAESPMIGQAI